MLILTRKAGEAVIISDETGEVRIVVVEVMSGNQVRLGFECDDDVDIFRQEVWDKLGEQSLAEALKKCEPPQ
jgi:carbon storage regulator CsrA